MGSLVKTAVQKRRRGMSYSLHKQRTWHPVYDANSMVTSRPLGKAEKVTPGRFCHYDATAIIIP
ncbi:MAG: hypothetical protein K2N05_06485 [Muribaculaceae bacterium]|nr:hypothetical protein [Muribaculaceae bacterium]